MNKFDKIANRKPNLSNVSDKYKKPVKALEKWQEVAHEMSKYDRSSERYAWRNTAWGISFLGKFFKAEKQYNKYKHIYDTPIFASIFRSYKSCGYGGSF